MKKINNILFYIAIIITTIVMFVFIGQKKGWHEDEIFSYGSSNYKCDNLFLNFGDKDSLNQLIDEKIVGKNIGETLKNISYYLKNEDEFQDELNKKIAEEKPIWKTKEQAKEYMTVSSDEIFNYWSVYYNQARDVHPPLFYMLVHLVSSICLNNFTKYIIFSINLIFYIASCFVLKKILRLFNKEELSWITVLLYGLSMGMISIVMFQRMYMMLTFFAMVYLYLNINIFKNSFEIDKKTKRKLTITVILGFLTQYYFCIYAALVAIISAICMIKNKKWDSLKRYVWCHVKAAIIGLILFPASIYHIFFSYRGAAGGVAEGSYLSRLQEYLKLIFYGFSIPEILGYITLGIIIAMFIRRIIIAKRKDIATLICLPIFLFVLVIAKIAPFINIRYISIVFPIIIIAIELGVVSSVKELMKIIKNDKIPQFIRKNASIIILVVIALVSSGYGLLKNKPEFLYTDYSKRIEIAEQYSNLKFVYIGQSPFNQLQDMEEFLRYDNSIIINTWQLDRLKEIDGLDDNTEFILNIKCWVSDFDKTLKTVLENTGAKDYELLIDDGQSRVYKVKK